MSSYWCCASSHVDNDTGYHRRSQSLAQKLCRPTAASVYGPLVLRSRHGDCNPVPDHRAGGRLPEPTESYLQHTSRTPEPGAAVPTRCSQAGPTDGQSAYSRACHRFLGGTYTGPTARCVLPSYSHRLCGYLPSAERIFSAQPTG